jgi:hypothetical protein
MEESFIGWKEWRWQEQERRQTFDDIVTASLDDSRGRAFLTNRVAS